MKLTSATIACLTTLAASAHAQTSLVANGAFAQGPAVSAGGSATVVAGQSLIPGWTVLRASVDYYTTGWQEPAGYAASIDLNGTSHSSDPRGAIAQRIATKTGAVYRESFYFSANPVANPHCPGMIRKMIATVGAGIRSYTWNLASKQNTVAAMQWEPESFEFTAIGTSTTISFQSLSIGWCGPVIAGVTITPVAAKAIFNNAIR